MEDGEDFTDTPFLNPETLCQDLDVMTVTCVMSQRHGMTWDQRSYNQRINILSQRSIHNLNKIPDDLLNS